MSNSIKAPFLKDPANKKKKRKASKAVRKAPLVADNGDYKKRSSSYEISDYSFRTEPTKKVNGRKGIPK